MSEPQARSGGLTAAHVHGIAAALCAVALAAAWFGSIGPAIASRAAAQAQRAAIAAQDEQADQLRNRVVVLERRLGQVIQEERASPLRLEPISRINRRLSEVSELAAASGLDLSQVKPGQVVRTSRFEVVPIELAGRGSYRACATFLHGAHEAFPDMGVAKVQIDRRLNSAESDADFAFTLAWYAAPSGRAGQSASVPTGP